VSRTVTLVGYAVLAAALVATSPRVWPWVRRLPPVRLVAIAGWLWLGWHVFVRASH
jgi:hypothetical protein